MKKILILGVNGFIGHHLSQRILDTTDWEVYGMDMNRERVRPFLDNPRFHFFEGDITINKEWIEYHIKKCDVVLPLVAIATPATYVKDPLRVFELDFEANLPFVRSCVKYRKRIIFPSTSEVYGKSTDVPFREDGDLVMGASIKGRWSYACSKAIDEFLALAYHKERGLPVVVFRLFNTVGPRQTGRYGMVIPNFVRQAISGHPITVYGDGEQRRCFTDVSDVVWALLRLAQSEEAVGQVINIGNDSREVSIMDLARLVKAKTKSPSEIVLVPYAQAYEEGFEDMPRRIPDLTKIKNLIGYEPKVDLDGVLDRVIEHFMTNEGRV